MTSWGEGAFDAYLPADMVLSQADIGIVVTDRFSNLLFLNSYAARLFRIPGDVSRLAGQPVPSLGLFSGDDVRTMEDIAGEVLRGRSWEGTFEAERGDGSRGLMRAQAVPLRHPGGDVDGIVILAREASKRDGQLQLDRIALLERVGERLAGAGNRDHVEARGGPAGPAVRRPLLHRSFPGRAAHPPRPPARQQLGARPGHLGQGRRADPLPGRPLLPAGHGAPGHGGSDRPGPRLLPGAERGEPGRRP